MVHNGIEYGLMAAYAEGLGFAGVLAGPLVRSSYRAGRLYQQASLVRPPSVS